MGELQALALIVGNELMAFMTLIIVFPGFLPPQDRMGWGMTVLMFIPMSFVWWLFLILFPFVYLFMWWAGSLEGFNPYFHSWPFNR